PVLEFAIGLRAESYFGCGRYHFLLQGGWESQIWINQTHYISISDHYDRFDLNLQGLTLRARFDF
ncbi:MAG: MOMP family protein, partial [Simkaniaceae bacterium]